MRTLYASLAPALYGVALEQLDLGVISDVAHRPEDFGWVDVRCPSEQPGFDFVAGMDSGFHWRRLAARNDFSMVDGWVCAVHDEMLGVRRVVASPSIGEMMEKAAKVSPYEREIRPYRRDLPCFRLPRPEGGLLELFGPHAFALAVACDAIERGRDGARFRDASLLPGMPEDGFMLARKSLVRELVIERTPEAVSMAATEEEERFTPQLV